jgi:cell division septum initiation protein DivIVA
MGLRKKKSLIDQASETVTQYVDHVKPQLESAVASAREKAGPAIADARTKAAPVIADARAKAAPVIADARAKAAPVIASGAALAAEKVAAGASLAAERAAEVAEAAADRATEAAAPTEKKGGRTKKLLLLSGLAAIAAFVAKKLRGSGQSDNWQSSYTPSPAPTPTATPPVGAAETPDDVGGSSPDEAIADQAESPHPITTPDDPAQVIDVEENNT